MIVRSGKLLGARRVCLIHGDVLRACPRAPWANPAGGGPVWCPRCFVGCPDCGKGTAIPLAPAARVAMSRTRAARRQP